MKPSRSQYNNTGNLPLQIMSNWALWCVYKIAILSFWRPASTMEAIIFGIIGFIYLFSWIVVDYIGSVRLTYWKYKHRETVKFNIMMVVRDIWYMFATPFALAWHTFNNRSK